MRLLTSILALFYFLNVVGYGVEVHYCLGQVSDVNHALLDTFCPCDDVHEEKANGCCEEKSFFVQLDDEHTSTASAENTKIQLPELTMMVCNAIKEPVQNESVEFNYPDRAPPLLKDIPVEYHSLQFYG